jgi:cell division protein FtsW
MVFSASPAMAMTIGDSYYYLKRHMLALSIGFAAMYAGMKLELPQLKNSAPYLIAASLFVLLLVLIPGVGLSAGGAKRWIYLGLFSFQPGEVVKLALIVFLAKELSDKPIKDALLPSLAALFAAGILILMQPDLGTALIVTTVAFIMFFLAGSPIKHLGIAAAASILSVLAISLGNKGSYRYRRIMAFLNPQIDPTGIGYHITQSMIAIGSGGLFGLGLGQSKQKFYYLPQNYTDFIFAIFCEEMGLIGAVGMVILFFLIIARGLRIVINSPDDFSLLLSGGIVSWIGFQSILNMAVVLGILPTTGIPLPFISYGGTAIVVTLFSVGLLLNVSQYTRASR